MSQEILKLLKSQDKKIDILTEQVEFVVGAVLGNTERLDKMDGRLDKMDGRLDKMDGRLDKMDGRLDKMDGRLDKMSSIVLDNTERLGRVESKLDKLPTAEGLNESMNLTDKVLKKLIKEEQESVMRKHGITRVEEKADKNTSDIRQIKPLVGLA